MVENRPTRTLVTGCCGFIASHLSIGLGQLGHEVVGIDWMKGSEGRKRESLEILENMENFRFIKGDVAESLPKEEFDFVVHLAALPGVRASIEKPFETFRCNAGVTAKVLDWAKEGYTNNLIYASSSSVYGLNQQIPFSEEDSLNSPNSPYAASKIATEVVADTYCRLFPIKAVGLRFFTVYGPRGREDMAIHKFLTWVSNKTPVTVFGDGSSSRDYTFVEDIVSGIIASMNYASKSMQPHSHEVFNLGNNSPIKLSDLIDLVGEIVGEEPIIDRQPDQLGDVPTTFANIDKAIKLLRYQPKTNLSLGLRKTWESMN